MPTVTHTLSDKEVRMACRNWVEAGCPHVEVKGVFLHSIAGSDDPREPSGPTVTATIETLK